MALCAIFLTACGETVPADPIERIIWQRQKDFKSLGAALKTIEDELDKKASSRDMDTVTESIQTLKTLTTDIPNWFPEGTGPDSGFDTDAKPEIWADKEDFVEKNDDTLKEIGILEQTMKTGNVDYIKAQRLSVGVACGGCHKPYRVKRD